MRSQKLKLIGILTAVALLVVPTQFAVSATPTERAVQKSVSEPKRITSNSSNAPTIEAAAAERIAKLEIATSVRKRDRLVSNRTTALDVTARNSRDISGASSGSRKRAVWYGTDCYYGEYYQAADLCWEDDATDAGSSLDAEIVWADTYVSWNDQTMVYTDIVPGWAITDDNWLLDPDNSLFVMYDTDGDTLVDIALVPDAVKLKKNKSAGARVVFYDESSDEWYYQLGSAGDDANCYAGIRRFHKSNHLAFGSKIGWWQISADWPCLFDYNAGNIGWIVAMEDYWGTDYTPDDAPDYLDYVDAMNFPLVTEITPRRGYSRGGGDVATVYGENLFSVNDIWERYEPVDYFDTISDSELEFETSGGVGCTDIDFTNDDWWVWYRNAICYR